MRTSTSRFFGYHTEICQVSATRRRRREGRGGAAADCSALRGWAVGIGVFVILVASATARSRVQRANCRVDLVNQWAVALCGMGVYVRHAPSDFGASKVGPQPGCELQSGYGTSLG